jgi:hypothetical protein
MADAFYPKSFFPKSYSDELRGVKAAIFTMRECLSKEKNPFQITFFDHRHETVEISTQTVILLPKHKYNRKQGDHQIPGAKVLRRNQFSKWYGDRPTDQPTDQHSLL